jgi:hypothetical protein
MKINHLKAEMKKKKNEQVMQLVQLALVITAHVKTTANTDHVGMKRNLNNHLQLVTLPCQWL